MLDQKIPHEPRVCGRETHQFTLRVAHARPFLRHAILATLLMHTGDAGHAADEFHCGAVRIRLGAKKLGGPQLGRTSFCGCVPSCRGSAVCAVRIRGGKFRVLEKKQWRGMDFAEQAKHIRMLCSRYSVTYIGIDTGSVGAGVYQLVKQFFPAVEAISYSLQIKTEMVLKAKDVISNGRLEFDASWTDLAHALITIRKTMTDSGRHATYTSGRGDDVGHADLAWALLHALAHEPIEGRSEERSNILEIL